MLDSLWYNVVPIERILMYFVLHMLTVDCDELLRYIPQLDKQEGWITYPSMATANNLKLQKTAAG